MDPYIRRIRFIATLEGMSERVRAHLLGIEDDAELVELYTVARDRRVFEVMYSIIGEIKRRADRGPLVYTPFITILDTAHA